MDLRWPLFWGSQFKRHFLLRVVGKPRIAPKFPRHLFSKESLINSNELRDNSTRTTCMAMRTWLEAKWQDLRVKRYIWHEIINKLSPFAKSKIWSNPYREAVTLKSILAWDPREIEDWAKISTGLLFRKIVK